MISLSSIKKNLFALSLLLISLGLAASTAWAASANKLFTLQDTRSQRVYGPFALREGEMVKIDARSYPLNLLGNGRVVLVDRGQRKVYGPIEPVEGRLVEIEGRMYEFSYRETANAGGPPVAPEWRPVANSRRPPPPKLIPIPEEPAPAAPPPLTRLPEQEDELRVSLWLAPRHDTAMKFKVGGQRANDFDISRTTLGGEVNWRGWRGSLLLSPSVSGHELLPQGMDVERSKLEDGTGWRVAAGYTQPLMRREGWLVEGGVYTALARDSLKLKTKSIVGSGGTNDTIDVSYSEFKDDITITELSLWLDLKLSYAVNW